MKLGKYLIVAAHTLLLPDNEELELVVPFGEPGLRVGLVFIPKPDDAAIKNQVRWEWEKDAGKVILSFLGHEGSLIGASVDKFASIGAAASGKEIGFMATFAKVGLVNVVTIQFMRGA